MVGSGCWWLEVGGCGLLWFLVVESGCFLVVSGCYWLVVVGLWLVVVGSS